MAHISKRATCGKRDWICYRDAHGKTYEERLSDASLKCAMLRVGTQGRIVLYSRHGGSVLVGWPHACIMLRNLRAGFYYHA